MSLRILTLGPGTNHELVARRYCAFHGLDPVTALGFFEDPDEGVRRVLAGEADHLLLCSVHPDVARVTAQNFRRLFIVDTFISPSKELAVLTRRGVASPRSLALFAPTLDYVDASRWEEVVVERQGSIVNVFARLEEGSVDSALVYLEYMDRHPGRFEVTELVGSPDDAWVVFGTTRAWQGQIVAQADSLVGRAARAAR